MPEPARPPDPPHERGLWWLLVPAAAAIAGLTAIASATWTSGRGAAIPASAQVGAGVRLPAGPVAAPLAPPAVAVPSTGTAGATPSGQATASHAIPTRPSIGATSGGAGSSSGTVVAPQYPVLAQGAQQPSGGASATGGTEGGDGSGSGTPDGSGPDGSGSSAGTSSPSGASPSGSDSTTSTTSTTTGTQAPGGTAGDR